MSDRPLSTYQTDVLRVLVGHDWRRDGCLSAPDISRKRNRRYDDWAYGKLVALEKRGLAERVGSTFSGALTWRATEAGMASAPVLPFIAGRG